MIEKAIAVFETNVQGQAKYNSKIVQFVRVVEQIDSAEWIASHVRASRVRNGTYNRAPINIDACGRTWRPNTNVVTLQIYVSGKLGIFENLFGFFRIEN